MQKTTQPHDRLHIFVIGRVQGVGFRAFARHTAQKLGLTGWVRNVGYDQVEAIAEGPRPILEEFIKIMQTGPRFSRVDETRLDWWPASDEFSAFSIQ